MFQFDRFMPAMWVDEEGVTLTVRPHLESRATFARRTVMPLLVSAGIALWASSSNASAEVGLTVAVSHPSPRFEPAVVRSSSSADVPDGYWDQLRVKMRSLKQIDQPNIEDDPPSLF